MPISITAVYENGVLRPLEKLDLPENEMLHITIELAAEAEPVQETLADVLGFDPHDEEKMRESGERQCRAIQKFLASLSEDSGSEPPHDGSINHDKYIYGIDWQ